MNWSRVMCLIGSHELTKWRKATETTQERHCKRPGCKFSRHKPLKPRRPSNFADTVRIFELPPPKDEK